MSFFNANYHLSHLEVKLLQASLSCTEVSSCLLTAARQINAHSLITHILTIRDHAPCDQYIFLPWLLGSQVCEATFRTIRSMNSTFSTVINFGMLGLLRRLHRLQIQSILQADTASVITFPRVVKHQVKEEKNCYIKQGRRTWGGRGGNCPPMF